MYLRKPVVSAYLLTILWLNTNPIRLFELIIAKKNVCFCVCDMQVRINQKLTKNHKKTGKKPSTRVEDGQRVKAGNPISFSVL